MDVQVTYDDRVPVLALSGRFDGFGALQFDETTQGIESDAPYWVLDLSGVSYMSSIGLRSLVTLEKTLRARDGGVVLVGVTRIVRQLLEISALDNWLRSQPTLADALAFVRAAAVGPVAEHAASGRLVRMRRMAGSSSCLEWWNAVREAPLLNVGLADLGFAFGTGGFGENAADARAALGAFVSTPAFAGVLPDDAHGVADFMAGGASSAVGVHVASALGMSGAPAFVAEVS